MVDLRRDTDAAQTSPHPYVYYLFERTPLGLVIHLSSSPATTISHHPTTIVFSDDTFECHESDILCLITYIKDSRPDLMLRIRSGETVKLLSPQIDPPVIRVTNKSERGTYFNLGELWRWRFLRKLRSYPFKTHQSYGARWLQGRHAAVLADDMGLGKTLQAIAALEEMQHSEQIHNALVLCPKSLIGVWEAEIKLWAPRLCTVALHSGIHAREWSLLKTQCHVAITNYDAIRRVRPEPGSFDLVIFDEIHRLKNPDSQNYVAAYWLNPRFAWGLSGTPLENHAGDLTAILHLLDRKRVSRGDRRLSAPSLRSLAANYVLRRPRKVISEELPIMVEKTELIPLSPEQRRSYDAVRACSRSIKTVGAWISLFNRLRNICDYDPHTGKSVKVDRAGVIIQSVRDLGEKVVVFSWKIEPLRLVRREVTSRHGASSVGMITGQTDSTTRSNIVARFQALSAPFVLLCSIRATAEGLTLTAANHVLFLNEWWNPAVNAQARDRVNRIGQERAVYVYRLRSQGTVESRIDDLLASKAALFDEIISRLTGSNHTAEESAPPEILRFVQ